MARKKSKSAEPIYFNPKEQSGGAKLVGGSNHDDFNQTLLNQVIKALWLAGSDPEYQDQVKRAVVAALAGIKPGDELEGMLAANIVATHFVRMECLRRGMREDRSAEQVKEAVNNATKLGRDLTGMVGALDKHRGRGQQRITVKHVHVNNGGQAIVGAISGRGVVPAVGHREADPVAAISYQPEQPMPPTGSAPEPVLVHADTADTLEGSDQLAETQGEARPDTGNLVLLRPSVADVGLAESHAGPQPPAKTRPPRRAG